MSDEETVRLLLQKGGPLTIDDLVTTVKLHGCCGRLHGFTTPEGWPYFLVAAVAKPGSERIVEMAEAFCDAVASVTTGEVRVDTAPWPERPTFTCPRCGRISHNPNDLTHRFCAACDEFFPEVHQ